MNAKIEEYAVQKFYDSRRLGPYKNARFKKAAKMSNVKEGDNVLDFGCFRHELKKYLPSVKYYGYDKNEKYSTVKDWRNLKDIDVVFALAVFEHIPEKDLNDLIKQFKQMRVKKIVAEVPWEDSPVNRFMCVLFGIDFEHYLTHVTGWRTATKALNKHFECTAYKHVYWLTWVSVWEPRVSAKN